jgi:tetratricopeptide (TPR) repeat protein
MWDLVSSQNQSAYEAATDLYEPGDLVNDMVHSLDWGQYGDLQRGDFDRARLWIARMEEIATKVKKQTFAVGTLARVKARLILETQEWKLQALDDDTPGPILLATGISAVKLGNLAQAAKAAELLDKAVIAAGANVDKSYYARNSKPLQIMRDEVKGLIQIAQGNEQAGLALLKQAVATAETMRPPNGAPNPIKPPHELYGEALLAAGKTADALALFDASLLRTPDRPASLLGAARTQVALGNVEEARLMYSKLAGIWGERRVPALLEATRYLASVEGE